MKKDLADKLKKALKFHTGDELIPQRRLEYLLKRLDPTFTQEELWALFDIADKNKDGMIEQDEFVNFVLFLDTDKFERHAPEHEEPMGGYGNNRKYETPWQNTSAVSKDHVVILYRVVRELDIDPSVEQETFSKATLLAAMEPNGILSKVKSEILNEAEDDKNLKMKQNAKHIFDRVHSMEFRSRLKGGGEVLDLETLMNLVWPKVKGKDAEMVLSWLKEFKMKDVVRRFYVRAMNDDNPELTPADVRFIFGCMDINNDGSVCLNELRRYGFLTGKEAKWLVTKLDCNWDKKLQIQEIMTCVFADAQGGFADFFKGAFASS